MEGNYNFASARSTDVSSTAFPRRFGGKIVYIKTQLFKMAHDGAMIRAAELQAKSFPEGKSSVD